MPAEKYLIQRWLYSTLTGDTATTNLIGHRVYDTLLPAAATPVAQNNTLYGIMLIRHAGKDHLDGFGGRMYVDVHYQIKPVCTGDSFGPLEALDNRIEALFNNVTQLQYSTSLMIVSCTRQDEIHYSNEDDGVRYNYSGGIYRVIAYYNGP